jgi:hypothetical protein
MLEISLALPLPVKALPRNKPSIGSRPVFLNGNNSGEDNGTIIASDFDGVILD